MPINIAAFFRSFKTLSCIAALTMSGCVGGPDDDPGLASAIRDHYAAHATEEQGICRSPKIDTIQAQQRVERSADGGDVVMVRYSYFDRHADMDANWDKLVYLSQPCGGIAERKFVVEHDQLGYRVTDMSGEHRGEESTR